MTQEHLREGDFFLLALPPGGSPEALPAHLSACASCARRFSEWRAAVGELSAAGFPPAGFERRVMDEVRRAGVPATRGLRRMPRARKWLARVSVAAGLLAAFWLGTRAGRAPARPEAPAPASSALNEADRSDDELLRDVSRLVSSDDDAGWKSVAPLPPIPEEKS